MTVVLAASVVNCSLAHEDNSITPGMLDFHVSHNDNSAALNESSMSHHLPAGPDPDSESR